MADENVEGKDKKKKKKSKVVKIANLTKEQKEELKEKVEALVDANDIMKEFNIARNALQGYVGRKIQVENKNYQIPNLYQDEKPKVADIIWSASRGVSISPTRLMVEEGESANELLEWLGDKEVSFEIKIDIGREKGKSKDIIGVTFTLTSE